MAFVCCWAFSPFVVQVTFFFAECLYGFLLLFIVIIIIIDGLLCVYGAMRCCRFVWRLMGDRHTAHAVLYANEDI